MATMTKDDILEAVSSMSVLELSELVKDFEEKFGVSAAAPAAAAVAAPAGGGDAAEEQTEFDVVLTGIGDKKIQVIKEVRGITGLGLKEAKDLVDNAPKSIKAGVTSDEANEIKEKIEAVGGQVDIK